MYLIHKLKNQLLVWQPAPPPQQPQQDNTLAQKNNQQIKNKQHNNNTLRGKVNPIWLKK